MVISIISCRWCAVWRFVEIDRPRSCFLLASVAAPFWDTTVQIVICDFYACDAPKARTNSVLIRFLWTEAPQCMTEATQCMHVYTSHNCILCVECPLGRYTGRFRLSELHPICIHSRRRSILMTVCTGNVDMHVLQWILWYRLVLLEAYYRLSSPEAASESMLLENFLVKKSSLSPLKFRGSKLKLLLEFRVCLVCCDKCALGKIATAKNAYYHMIVSLDQSMHHDDQLALLWGGHAIGVQRD